MKDEPLEKEFHLSQTQWLVNRFFFKQSDKSRKNAKFKERFWVWDDREPKDGI